MPRFFSASNKRQKPARMPYSCQDQLGRSGNRGTPIGGGSTVRGWARSIDQCSTLTMTQTSMRLPAGAFKIGRWGKGT